MRLPYVPNWSSLTPDTQARFIDKFLADASSIAKRTGGASFERKDVVEFIHCLSSGDRPIGLNDTQERILGDLFEAVRKKARLSFKPPKGTPPAPAPSLSSPPPTVTSEAAELPPSDEEEGAEGEETSTEVGGGGDGESPSPPEAIGTRAMTPAPAEPALASSEGEAEREEPDVSESYAKGAVTPAAAEPGEVPEAAVMKGEATRGRTAGEETTLPRPHEPRPELTEPSGIEVVGSPERLGADPAAPPAPARAHFSPKRQIALLRENYLASEPPNGHPHPLREWVAPPFDPYIATGVLTAGRSPNGHHQLDLVGRITYEEVGTLLAPRLLEMREGRRVDYDRLRAAVTRLYEACVIADTAGDYLDAKRGAGEPGPE